MGLDANKANKDPGGLPAADNKSEATKPTLPLVTGDDFAKLDLRVGTITKAERVQDADKLLKLEVEFGDLGTRTIAAGIAQDFEPEKLVNTQVVAVVNLPPRTLRGVESNGMILAAKGAGGKLSLVTCTGTNGSKVG